MTVAILVMDMLSGFLEPGHPLYVGDTGREIIPSIQELLEYECRRGSRVFFIADREDASIRGGQYPPPRQILALAQGGDCLSISYTYTEATIFFEYAYDTARQTKSQAPYNAFVTNGFMTERATDTIAPYPDAANIDLKSFSDAYYKRTCKARSLFRILG